MVQISAVSVTLNFSGFCQASASNYRLAHNSEATILLFIQCDINIDF